MSAHVSDEQLSLLIDGELSLAAREVVGRHLTTCPACAERHDALIEVAATLRLQPPATWNPQASVRTVERLPRRRERDRALPLAVAIAAAAAAAVSTQEGLTGAALTASRSSFDALSAVVPNGLLLGHVGALALLGALVLLGLLAYPLARWR